MPCQYACKYGDGSSTSGYFVSDNIHLAKVSGNGQTTILNGNVTFGWVFMFSLSIRKHKVLKGKENHNKLFSSFYRLSD